MAVKTQGDRLKAMFDKAHSELSDPGAIRDDFYMWLVGMFGRFEAMFDVENIPSRHLDYAEASLNEKIKEVQKERNARFALAGATRNCGNCGHATELGEGMMCHLEEELKGLDHLCDDWTEIEKKSPSDDS